jgi:ribose-phosphate pyrophosphokinase
MPQGESMIKIKTESEEVIVTPTIFPDGTSQVWKLDSSVLKQPKYRIIWNFEAEREIFDLHSLVALLRWGNPYFTQIQLHIPYLPYGRQDKTVSNDTTFNLTVFATLINNLGLDLVSSVDVHNPSLTEKLINNFSNHSIEETHRKIISTIEPTFVVFPDKGAMSRYHTGLSQIDTIFCDKVRDQATGQILGTTVNMNRNRDFISRDRILIVDDICDGGATFIGVAKALREKNENMQINLFVTHGIFSKGKGPLLDGGIDHIYTTNSLLKNSDGFPV